MFSRVIVPSIVLAALANGLVFRRDDGYYSSSSTPPALSLPTVALEPISLPEPLISLSLPPVDLTPTGTTISLPNPSFSLSLPPLNPSLTGTLTSSMPSSSLSSSRLPSSSLSPSVSVVTTTVYVYPTQCLPTPTGNPPSPSDDLGDTLLQDGASSLPAPAQPTPITLPQASPLNLPPVRRDDADSVVFQTPVPLQEPTPIPVQEPTPIALPQASPWNLPPVRRDDPVVPHTPMKPTPMPPQEPTPMTPQESIPMPPQESTPMPEQESMPPQESTPMPGQESTPMPGQESTPMPGQESTPMPGQESTPIMMPQASTFSLPLVRRDDADSVVSQMRALEQQVMSTYVNLGKGDEMLSVIGQIENLIAQAVVPDADVDALLEQAQNLVNDS